MHIDLDRQGGYPLRGTPLSCRTFVVQAPAFVYCDSVKNNRMYNVPCVREKPSECDGPRARPRAEDASRRDKLETAARRPTKSASSNKRNLWLTSLHFTMTMALLLPSACARAAHAAGARTSHRPSGTGTGAVLNMHGVMRVVNAASLTFSRRRPRRGVPSHPWVSRA